MATPRQNEAESGYGLVSPEARLRAEKVRMNKSRPVACAGGGQTHYLAADQVGKVTLCSACQGKRDPMDIPPDEALDLAANASRPSGAARGRKPGLYLRGLAAAVQERNMEPLALAKAIGHDRSAYVRKQMECTHRAAPATVRKYAAALGVSEERIIGAGKAVT
jgi:hypothetical protein